MEKKPNSNIKLINEYVTIDIETTGFRGDTDKIIEIGACKVKDGKIIDEYTTLVNPEQKLSDVIEKITGIKDEMLQQAETISFVLPKLFEFIGDLPIVIYSDNFVMKFIRKDCSRLDLNINNEVIDALYLCKKTFPECQFFTPRRISEFLDIENNFDRIIDYARFDVAIFEAIKRYFNQ